MDTSNWDLMIEHDFDLGGQLTGMGYGRQGNEILEWSIAPIEVPAIYLITIDGEIPKVGKAEKFYTRTSKYAYWRLPNKVTGKIRKQDEEHNKLMDEMADGRNVQIYFKEFGKLVYCPVLQKEVYESPNLFEYEVFYKKLFGARYA